MKLASPNEIRKILPKLYKEYTLDEINTIIQAVNSRNTEIKFKIQHNMIILNDDLDENNGYQGLLPHLENSYVLRLAFQGDLEHSPEYDPETIDPTIIDQYANELAIPGDIIEYTLAKLADLKGLLNKIERFRTSENYDFSEGKSLSYRLKNHLMIIIPRIEAFIKNPQYPIIEPVLKFNIQINQLAVLLGLLADQKIIANNGVQIAEFAAQCFQCKKDGNYISSTSSTFRPQLSYARNLQIEGISDLRTKATSFFNDLKTQTTYIPR